MIPLLIAKSTEDQMAWSENTRQQYPHGETRYASDYLDAEWVGFEPLFRRPRIAQRLRLARPGLIVGPGRGFTAAEL